MKPNIIIEAPKAIVMDEDSPLIAPVEKQKCSWSFFKDCCCEVIKDSCCKEEYNIGHSFIYPKTFLPNLP